MSHAIHRVTRFEIAGPHILNVVFEDGTNQRIDFRPVLKGVLFGPLQDLAFFNAVALDPEAGTLTWPTELTSIPRCFTTGRMSVASSRHALVNGQRSRLLLRRAQANEWNRRAADTI
jgi:hypothetical protein